MDELKLHFIHPRGRDRLYCDDLESAVQLAIDLLWESAGIPVWVEGPDGEELLSEQGLTEAIEERVRDPNRQWAR